MLKLRYSAVLRIVGRFDTVKSTDGQDTDSRAIRVITARLTCRLKIVTFSSYCALKELSRGLCEMLSSSDKSSHVASASSAAAVHMLGVDLDCQLVERAREMSSGLQLMATDYSLSFETLNVVTEAEKRDQMWRSYLTARNRSRFDVVFCFSTTMWVGS